MSNTKQDHHQLLKEYEPLLYRCMKKRYINFNDPNYEDYLQLARLALLSASQNSEVDPLSEEIEDRYQFISYASTRIIWAIRDEQRKFERIYEREQTVTPASHDEEDTLDIWDTLSDTQVDDTSTTTLEEDLFKSLKLTLTEQEWRLLTLLLDEELNQSQRANHLGISRRTYYQRLNSFRKKMAYTLPKLGFN